METIHVDDGYNDSVDISGCLRWALNKAAHIPNASIDIKPNLEIVIVSPLQIHKSTTVIYGNGAAITSSNSNIPYMLSIEGSTVELHDLILDGETRNRQGLHVDLSTVRCYNTTIVDFNSADQKGGGLYARMSTIILENSKLTNCTAIEGGGLYSHNSVLSCNRLIVDGCTSGAGGGIYLTTSSYTINQSIIRNNKARNRGGGIFIEAQSTGSITSSLINKNNTISSEHNPITVGGGGIRVSNSALTLINSTIANNTSGTVGGGIHSVCFAGPVSLIITNCTIGSNINTKLNLGGAGVYVDGSIPIIANTIIGYNSGGTDQICNPEIICQINGQIQAVDSKGGNVINIGAPGFDSPKDITGTFKAIVHSGILPLANNGGFSETMALVPSSVAICNGLNKYVPEDLPFDQRGKTFDRIIGLNVNSGAFEC